MPPARRGYGYVAAHARRVRYGWRAGTGVSVPARRHGQSERYGRTGDGTGEQMFCPRAHCLSENRSRRLSALRSAVKTAERSEALA